MSAAAGSGDVPGASAYRDPDLLLLSSSEDGDGGREAAAALAGGEDFALEEDDIELLDAERRDAANGIGGSGGGGGRAEPADWSRPGHGGGPPSYQGGREEQDGNEEGAAAADDDVAMGLFVIDSNPDPTLLQSVAPPAAAQTSTATDSGAASSGQRIGSTAAQGAQASVDADADMGGGGDAAAASTAAEGGANAPPAQHLAAPGEHVLTNGLLLPTNVILEGEDLQSRTQGEEDLGDYEQIDATRTVRYYAEKEEEERQAKDVCRKCGEQGHNQRVCPHIKCLKCGAMDEHSTNACPLGVQCFRCGQVGHMSKECKNKAMPGAMSRQCDRCGSSTHRSAACPTLWRVYVYRSEEEYTEARQRKHEALQQELVAQGGGFGGNSRQKGKARDDGASAENAEDLGQPRKDWDPATRWCFNCGVKGNHWGDDCPMPRASHFSNNRNPRVVEPSIFSERVSRTGPYAHELERAPARVAGPSGVPSSTSFDFQIGPGASMHLSADPASLRADRGSSSYGFGNPRDRRTASRRERYDDDAHDRRRGGDGGVSSSGSRRHWEGRAGGHTERNSGDEDDWFAERGKERSSKRSKRSGRGDDEPDRAAQRRRRREGDDDDDEYGDSGRGASRSKRSRDGASLLDRLSSGGNGGRDHKSKHEKDDRRKKRGSKHRDGEEGSISGSDDEGQSTADEDKKGKGKATDHSHSPSRTLGASGVIELSDSDDDKPLDNLVHKTRRGLSQTEPIEILDDDDDDDDDNDNHRYNARFQPENYYDEPEFEIDDSRTSIRSFGRHGVDGPARNHDAGYGAALGNQPFRQDQPGEAKPQKKASSRAPNWANAYGDGGGLKKTKNKKRKYGGGGGGGGGKPAKQGSAAPASKREGSVKSEGSGSGGGGGGKRRKGGRKAKSSAQLGGGGGGGVKRERSATPAVKREFKPMFNGGY